MNKSLELSIQYPQKVLDFNTAVICRNTDSIIFAACYLAIG